MDAVALLENMGLKVKLKGNWVGKVISQSILSSKLIEKNKSIEIVVN